MFKKYIKLISNIHLLHPFNNNDNYKNYNFKLTLLIKILKT